MKHLIGCVLGLETPRILGRQLWRMLLEICCREKKIMENPRRKHLVKTLEMEKRRTLKMRW